VSSSGVDELIAPIGVSERQHAGGRRTWWLALGGAVAGLWWTLWPTLNAPFGMADDHAIIDMTAPSGHLSWWRMPETAVRLSSEHVGRFRPLYWTGQAFEAALWGRHPNGWYVDRLLLATVTLVCLYILLSHIVHPVLAGLIALLPFSGPQVETWTRLGPNEAYAMPLTAAGLTLVLIPAPEAGPIPVQRGWGISSWHSQGSRRRTSSSWVPACACSWWS
jgi:hypothetical protein